MSANDIVLKPVRPNAGIEASYRKALNKLLQQMHDSVMYWLKASYKSNEPVIAQDALPSSALRAAIRKLVRRWQKRFNGMAPKLAKFFSTAVSKRSDAALQKILKQGGITVEFKMTRAQKDVLNATVNQNVNLIKSIPQQYLNNVEGMVMRSVQTGRDLGTLAKELQKQYGVTKRRAALISRDQNNKATSALTRARQVELGIKKALWIHSYAGKKPRPTHLRNNGKPYDIVKGWLDPSVKKFIHPGELVNCRCVSRSIIPGFETPAVSADPALAKILKQYGVTKRKGRIVNL